MKLTAQNTRADYTDSNVADITILEGDDSGIVFRYGKVWINDEDPENPSLHFHYDVMHGTPVNKQSFEQDIAGLLHSLILEKLEAGEVQYSGGTDTAPDGTALESLIKEAETGIEVPESTGLEFQSLNTQVGAFLAKKEETAVSFLDRLASEGEKAMNKGIIKSGSGH